MLLASGHVTSVYQKQNDSGFLSLLNFSLALNLPNKILWKESNKKITGISLS